MKMLQGDIIAPDSTRQLRGQARIQRHDQRITPPSPTCAVIAEASIYIAADSDFVNDAIEECDTCRVSNNNKVQKAEAAIQEIFSAVRDLYLSDLCIDLKLKGYDIRTDKNNDPYRDIRLASNDICSTANDSFIETLAEYLAFPGNDRSGGDRTLFHLFYGVPNASGARTIGCAFVGKTCNAKYGVGISEMSFRGVYSSNLRLKRNLLAHELAHNINAEHNAGIMAPSSSTSAGFTDFSISQILGCINGACQDTSCLKFSVASATVDESAEKKAAPTCADYDQRKPCRRNAACVWRNYRCTDRKAARSCSDRNRKQCQKKKNCAWNSAVRTCHSANEFSRSKCSDITDKSKCRRSSCKWRNRTCVAG